MSDDWSQQLADELHKPITKNFSKKKVISNGIDKIWAADLVEMQKFSKWNKGIKYLLMVTEVFSKYGWIAPLKDKKTESVSKAVKNFLQCTKSFIVQNKWQEIDGEKIMTEDKRIWQG